MIKFVHFTLGLFASCALVGCVHCSCWAGKSSPDDVAKPAPGTVEIVGTVVHKGLEGGFFAIDADDGAKYTPLHLAEAYRKDGLRVKVLARPRPDVMSIQMYGTMIEIVEIVERER